MKNYIRFKPGNAPEAAWIILTILFCFHSWNSVNGQKVVQLYQHTDKSQTFHGDMEAVVEINPLIYTLTENNKGDFIAVEVEKGSNSYFEIDKICFYQNGTLTIRARSENKENDYILLAITDGMILGDVHLGIDNNSFRIIQRLKNGEAILNAKPQRNIELPGAPAMNAEQPIVHDESYLQRIRESKENAGRNQASIDLMIVYTPAAKAWADYYEGSIYNTTALAIEKAQLALDLSQVLIDLNIVNVLQINYEESGSPETDLHNLTFSNGIMDEVHLWRNQYGADLVTLFSFENLVGGVAWQLNNQLGGPDYGFSLIRIQQASWTYTMIHELGHCLGAGHHAGQNFQPGPTIWVNWPENTWSAGWRWTGTDGVKYCDLMTYEEYWYYEDEILHTRVPVFSNPEVSIHGTATGEVQYADNAKTLREMRHVVASYKTEQLADLPKVTTHMVTEITANTALGHGVVTNEGQSSVTAFGVCWSENEFPTLNDSFSIGGSGIGSISTYISELEPNKQYYVRAFATNSSGTAYGNQVQFITSSIIPDGYFVTVWRLPAGQNKLEFYLKRSTNVSYYWETVPSAQMSGTLMFTPGDGLVQVNGLPQGTTIRIGIAPAGLQQFASARNFQPSPDRELLFDVEQWGTANWTDMHFAFEGCTYLDVSAKDIPDLTNVLSFNSMFSGCLYLNGPSNISEWDVSNVIDMTAMFFDARFFNQPIGQWDVSNVTSTGWMFFYAERFNQPIGMWNVSNVGQFSAMFGACFRFNQDLSDWDVSAAYNMYQMFMGAFVFNQEIGSWDVSSVTNMSAMFHRADVFNSDISNWDVSSVTNFEGMFHGAFAFNQPIGNWNVSNATNMGGMFSYAYAFNQDIGQWNVSNVTKMSGIYYGMFTDAKAFNQDIGDWDVSSVTSLRDMFSFTEAFNQDIGGWDVTSVTDFGCVFYRAVAFNQDIGGWDVSNARTMDLMFAIAKEFNKDISGWDVSKVTNMGSMFRDAEKFDQNLASWELNSIIPGNNWWQDLNMMFANSGLSCQNYTNTLIGWSENEAIASGLHLGAEGRQYTDEAVTARNYLINTKGWTIAGDMNYNPPPQPEYISGSDFVTAGNSYEYMIDAVSGAEDYYWYYSGDGSVTGDGTAVMLSPTSGGELSVMASNSCGTSPLQTKAIQIQNAAQVITEDYFEIYNTHTICKGNVVTDGGSPIIERGIAWSSDGTPSVLNTHIQAGNELGEFTVDITGLIPETEYYIRAYAINASGTSYGEIRSFTTSCFNQETPVIQGLDEICEGITTVFSIEPIEGAESYEWMLPKGWIGYSQTNSIQCTIGNLGGTIYVMGINYCGESPEGTLMVLVHPLPEAAGVINGPESVCQFQQDVVFWIDPIANATSYEWILPAGASGNSTTNSISVDFSDEGLAGEIKVKGINTCGFGSTSSKVVSIQPILTVEVFIEANTDIVCMGDAVEFTAVSVNGGNYPTYQWKVNGINAGTNSPNFSYAPAHNDMVTVELTSSELCTTGNPALSNVIIMVVNPLLPVGVSIQASANNVCEGTEVGFTVEPTNGGSNPTYQWKINGINAGSNNSSFNYTPAHNDMVTVALTSSELCTTGNPALSNAISMVVHPLLPVGISIQATANNVCEGTEVGFTAEPTNGGSDPTYQWKINGTNAGSNNSSFNYTPAHNDMVTVALTSSELCTTGNPASSNAISMVVYPLPDVSWTEFEPDTVCIFWDPILLYGGLPSGGVYSGNGVSNGYFNPTIAGVGEHSLTYQYTDTQNCSSQASITIFVDYCTNQNEKPLNFENVISIAPNPACDEILIIMPSLNYFSKGYRIVAMNGEIIFDEKRELNHRSAIDLSRISSGLYYLYLYINEQVVVKRFIVLR
ncbi:MAG: BspA family leucine-rich repeat surface protein [Bacteroidetes bacterium]|nr:BspA family leucine-rich repeat surface protein [Bacteroidota bacterium]